MSAAYIKDGMGNNYLDEFPRTKSGEIPQVIAY